MRNKKHIWLPLALFLYLAVMAYIGRDALNVPQLRLKYFLTIGAEIAILIALHFFLKWRARLKQEREKDLLDAPSKDNPTDQNIREKDR